jgi:membrane protein YqaA with SNARE-associated domain
VKRFLLPLYGILAKLGGFGLLILGIFDSSFLFMPLGNDLLMLGLTARHPDLLLYYAFMATLGSMIGCFLIDWICRKGGEQGLHRVLPEKRIEYVKNRVRKSAGPALALAAIMPPPFPFTPFVAVAAAFQYPRKKLFGILAPMRMLRFSVIGLLAILYGPGIIELANAPAVEYTIGAIVVVCVVGSVISIYGWIKRSRTVSGRRLAHPKTRTA